MSGPRTEPLIHSGVTDTLPEGHPLVWTTVYCYGKGCRETLHATPNENMQTWVETSKGNYCLPCFTASDQADGYEGWDGP